MNSRDKFVGILPLFLQKWMSKYLGVFDDIITILKIPLNLLAKNLTYFVWIFKVNELCSLFRCITTLKLKI